MATTTNFGWETPDDTDLVKDGAAAIRTVANSIDTSFVDLKGGTTGQILSKASNTDLDYTWINNDTGDITGVTAGTGISGGGTSGTVTVTNSMATAIDAKGDLIAGTGADAFDRLAVGTNGQVLQADSTTSTGLKWATAASSGTKSFALINAGGTAMSGSATCTVSSLSGYENLIVVVSGGSTSSASGARIGLRINSDSGTNYIWGGFQIDARTTYGKDQFEQSVSTGAAQYTLCFQANNAGDSFGGALSINGGNNTGGKGIQSAFGSYSGSGTNAKSITNTGLYLGSAVISSVSIITDLGTFDAGTMYVYGAL